MRVYAPSTFASLMDWEVRNDSFLFYPKYGGTRWLIGAACTFNSVSYAAQGDSIQIDTHGGDGVCVFSLTAFSLEVAWYFARHYSVAWMKDVGHMVKSWKSGEYAVAISNIKSKASSLDVCQQNTNWLVAEMPEGSATVTDFTSGKFYNPSDRAHTPLMGQSWGERRHYFRTCRGATTWCKNPDCPYTPDQYT
ncbi:hypothetical protein STCU_12252 [Strigomonas culicis]|uniref:Uncharacterized protein n=1 Tax=Strigomonas culicis TaxID=28005 RepID=S9TFU5_9TRYP|nr:hypothetical protein STCU_12252 [Strigomonas culicis]|eukprot:EPY15203.1 hypothetical protein STCU_12252 [Strigomonas culicis]